MEFDGAPDEKSSPPRTSSLELEAQNNIIPGSTPSSEDGSDKNSTKLAPSSGIQTISDRASSHNGEQQTSLSSRCGRPSPEKPQLRIHFSSKFLHEETNRGRNYHFICTSDCCRRASIGSGIPRLHRHSYPEHNSSTELPLRY